MAYAHDTYQTTKLIDSQIPASQNTRFVLPLKHSLKINSSIFFIVRLTHDGTDDNFDEDNILTQVVIILTINRTYVYFLLILRHVYGNVFIFQW